MTYYKLKKKTGTNEWRNVTNENASACKTAESKEVL